MKRICRHIAIALGIAAAVVAVWHALPSQSSSGTVKPSIFGGGAA